ncbi:carboxymuconolactone decarboxylase family protein [Microbacterium sp. Marseille-Q6965]|uniref:carboxymuconolactone decarboxylase family protein n=1 Tax=Microbacterium sp. Marseille-Q6965 TaxID=2965072 RepID=UPI0021B6FBFB|nr:carboxymuconolactone decarboxylase family protein [Microbacterium sp. Marseille-Q6965]
MSAAFAEFNAAVFRDGTALDRKTKELLAVAVALTTQCQGCLRAHTRQAVRAGATQAELAETVHVAAALRAGGAMFHGGSFVMPHSHGPNA